MFLHADHNKNRVLQHSEEFYTMGVSCYNTTFLEPNFNWA